MAARRAPATDPATASAIEELIQSRTAGLYTLAAKVQELTAARDAVATAQAAERALLAEALELQQTLVASGWSLEELRTAGLYVGAPAVRRRRTTAPPAAQTTTPDGAAPDVVDLSSGPASDGGSASADGQGSPVDPVDAPVPVG